MISRSLEGIVQGPINIGLFAGAFPYAVSDDRCGPGSSRDESTRIENNSLVNYGMQVRGEMPM